MGLALLKHLQYLALALIALANYLVGIYFIFFYEMQENIKLEETYSRT